MIQDKFNLQFKTAGADRGYDTTPIHHGLKTLSIDGYIPPKQYTNGSISTSHHEFTYNQKTDVFVCPAQKELPFNL